MSHPLWNALLLDAASLPLWIVLLAGIGLSIRQWAAHPRISLLALVAFTLGLASLGLGVWHRAWVFQAQTAAFSGLAQTGGPGALHAPGPDLTPRLVAVGSLVALGQVVLKTVSWTLALLAIFLRR